MSGAFPRSCRRAGPTLSPRGIAIARETPAVTHRRLGAVRARDTSPELVVRRLVHSLGFRFRLHRRDLPGRPDLVLPRHRTAILVHGCYWHRHEGCSLASDPKRNRPFSRRKLAANREREARNEQALRAADTQPHAAVIPQQPLSHVNLLGLTSDRLLLLWVQNRESTWRTEADGRQPQELTGLRLSVPVPADGAWRVQWWDTFTGEIIRQDTPTATGAR
jgi:DNA mismatch endonuclease (patch repair protein)